MKTGIFLELICGADKIKFGPIESVSRLQTDHAGEIVDFFQSSHRGRVSITVYQDAAPLLRIHAQIFVPWLSIMAALAPLLKPVISTEAAAPYDQAVHINDRLPGCYWVKYQGEWIMGEWFPIDEFHPLGYWELIGVEDEYHDSDFEQIDHWIIDNPDEIE